MCAVLAVAMHLILTQPLDLRRKIDPEKGEYMVQDLYLARSDEYIGLRPIRGISLTMKRALVPPSRHCHHTGALRRC